MWFCLTLLGSLGLKMFWSNLRCWLLIGLLKVRKYSKRLEAQLTYQDSSHGLFFRPLWGCVSAISNCTYGVQFCQVTDPCDGCAIVVQLSSVPQAHKERCAPRHLWSAARPPGSHADRWAVAVLDVDADPDGSPPCRNGKRHHRHLRSRCPLATDTCQNHHFQRSAGCCLPNSWGLDTDWSLPRKHLRAWRVRCRHRARTAQWRHSAHRHLSAQRAPERAWQQGVEGKLCTDLPEDQRLTRLTDDKPMYNIDQHCTTN